ncbi:hypothetical protein [Amycolatopsis sp. cmx-4-68]|uniref:hypothetical protein n=1 Tax=Amycolatopsis sp. cmx-4-68 TaxID=2790938 RepID=UPI00397B1004
MSTEAERKTAATWLAKRGISVTEPTELLALRLGVRRGARPPGYWTGIGWLVTVTAVSSFGLAFLPLLPGVAMSDVPEGRLTVVMFAVVLLANRLPIRWADRRAAAWLGDRRLDRPRPSWRAVLNGWYLASLVVTFGGGAALGVAMAVSGSVWAVLWLGLLAAAAAVVGVVLAGVLRRPVLAEDEGSLAVDAATRSGDVLLVLPSMFALPVVADLATTNRQPHEFTPWLIGYVVLAVGTQVIGVVVHRRRRPALPVDGDYEATR